MAQKALLGAGAAVAGAALSVKKTVGQKKSKEEKAAGAQKSSAKNVLQSQNASSIAAEKAKSSLAEHREAKKRSTQAKRHFVDRDKLYKQIKKDIKKGD